MFCCDVYIDLMALIVCAPNCLKSGNFVIFTNLMSGISNFNLLKQTRWVFFDIKMLKITKFACINFPPRWCWLGVHIVAAQRGPYMLRYWSGSEGEETETGCEPLRACIACGEHTHVCKCQSVHPAGLEYARLMYTAITADPHLSIHTTQHTLNTARILWCSRFLTCNRN